MSLVKLLEQPSLIRGAAKYVSGLVKGGTLIRGAAKYVLGLVRGGSDLIG